MDLNLENKVVLVTGGASGIGARIARRCAEEGAIPVIFDRNQAAMQGLQVELQQRPTETEVVTIELANTSEISRAVERVAQKFGHIYGLVNNAGVNDGVGLEHGSPDRFAASLKNNLVHYYATTQAVLPFLKKSRGSIVNMGSKVAVTGQGGTSGYAAAKGAILGLTSEWAFELSPFEVRVNAVVPAEVMTPQYESWLKTFPDPQEQLESIASKIPLGRRLTDVNEIASMTAFLLSPKSAGITGQCLFVDGGYVHLDRRLT